MVRNRMKSLLIVFALICVFAAVYAQHIQQNSYLFIIDDVKAQASSDVRGQINALNDSDPLKRAQAACALGRMEKRAVPAISSLIKMLDDGTRLDPRQICYRRPHDDQSGQPEFEYLIEPSPGEAAVEALIAIGHPSVESLIISLKDKSARVRKNSAWALANLRDQRALKSLLVSINDEAWQVRAYSAIALGEQGDAKAIESLTNALKDESPNVRWFAAASLGHYDDRRAIKPLLLALRDSHPRVRTFTAASLGMYRDDRVVDSLISALGDNSSQVRMYAAASLGQLGDKRAIEPLTLALKNEESAVRYYIQASLTQLKH